MPLPHTQLAPFDPNVGDWSRGGYSISKTGSNMLGSIISGAGSLLGGLFGGIFGNHQQKQANKYNRQMLQQQFQYNSQLAAQQLQYNRQLAQEEYNRNIEQWQRENEYNSPLSQLARLSAAGINPHLAYAKGSINNVAASSPSYNAPTYNAPEYGYEPFALPDTSKYVALGSDIVQNAIRSSIENRNLAAQGDYVRAQTQNTLLSAAGKSTDNRIKAALESEAIEQGRMRTDELRWKIDSAIVRYNILSKENSLKTITFDNDVQRVQTILEKLQAEVTGQKLLNDLRRQQKNANLPKSQSELNWWHAWAIARTGGFTGDAASLYILANMAGIALQNTPKSVQKTLESRQVQDALRIEQQKAEQQAGAKVFPPQISLR